MSKKKNTKKKTTLYPKIGDRIDEDDPKGVFTLDLSVLRNIDPADYFITSGEAVAKAEKLDKDYWAAAGASRKLLGQLKKARGQSKYLEVTWENEVLVCRRKDPRKTKNRKAK